VRDEFTLDFTEPATNQQVEENAAHDSPEQLQNALNALTLSQGGRISPQ
jgi:hypothetical protein